MASLIDLYLSQRENLYQEYPIDQLNEVDWHLIHLRMAEQILKNQTSQQPSPVKSKRSRLFTWAQRIAIGLLCTYSIYASYELFFRPPVERLSQEQKNQLAFISSPQGLWGAGITLWNPQGLRCLEEQKDFIRKAAITVEVNDEKKGKQTMLLESGMCLLWVVPPENRKLTAVKPKAANPTVAPSTE